jgi:hypothetical protein
MFGHIRRSLLHIPNKALTVVEKMEVHVLNVYTLYISSQVIAQ